MSLVCCRCRTCSHRRHSRTQGSFAITKTQDREERARGGVAHVGCCNLAVGLPTVRLPTITYCRHCGEVTIKPKSRGERKRLSRIRTEERERTIAKEEGEDTVSPCAVAAAISSSGRGSFGSVLVMVVEEYRCCPAASPSELSVTVRIVGSYHWSCYGSILLFLWMELLLLAGAFVAVAAAKSSWG
ncbi:uncharacterized protein DS421_3g97520 [Arachis hypogaea]|nr:uncharacterized protein DS421_3g97520 [Arachis hypogaea]